jgi:hypothetical protein
MIFENQKTPRDCFPTCFSNAMLYLDVPVIPALEKRLEVFNNGTENCTIYSSEEKLEQYERSIHKLISEWNWACNHYEDEIPNIPMAEIWAKYLFDIGINIEFKNGPIEQSRIIKEALAKNKIVICETLEPSSGVTNSEAKHFVLIVKLLENVLLIHDPLLVNRTISSETFRCKLDECGSNIEMDCDYFFSHESGPLKPKPNQYQTDWGYKFLLISKYTKGSK